MTHNNFPYPDTFVIVNGFRMHYFHSGTESPLNVIMLHDSRSSARSYRQFFPYLIAAGFRCFAPDAIGFGESDSPDDPSLHSFDFHSDNLETFIRELGLRNVILVGHEWGSLVALDYAINRSDNTVALALSDAGVFLPNRTAGIRGLLHKSFLADVLMRRLNFTLDNSRLLGRIPHNTLPSTHFTDASDPFPPSLPPAATRLGFLRMTAQAGNGYNAIRMKTIRNALPHLPTPTLHVRFDKSDLFTRAESQYLQEHIPYVESHKLTGNGASIESHHDVIASLIVGFLRPLTTSATRMRTPAVA